MTSGAGRPSGSLQCTQVAAFGSAGEKDFAPFRIVCRKSASALEHSLPDRPSAYPDSRPCGRRRLRLPDLPDEEDPATWDIAYAGVFASGVAEAALDKAAFLDLIP